MADIFLQEDTKNLFHNKFVVLIGDSIQRGIYKDLVLLLQKNRYLKDSHLRAKGELSFENDELIEGGRKGIMSNGINYQEVRQFQSDWHLVRFYFTTRCYNTYVESVLADLQEEPRPDVIIMNSCLWDISRYGKNGVEEYKKNLVRLFDHLNEVLPEECLFIWNATLPVSRNARGGFLVPEVEFMNSSLRLDILEANFYAREVVVAHGYDMIDLHFYLRNQLHRRAQDGIHWDMTAHRRITNLLLTHVSEAWKERLPGRSQERRQLISSDVNENVIEPGEEDDGKESDVEHDDPNNNRISQEELDQNPYQRFIETDSSYGGRREMVKKMPAVRAEKYTVNQDMGRFQQYCQEQTTQHHHRWHITHPTDNLDVPNHRQDWGFNNNTVQVDSARQERLFQQLVANARAVGGNGSQTQRGWNSHQELNFDQLAYFGHQQGIYFDEQPSYEDERGYQGHPDDQPMTLNFNAPVTLNVDTALRGTQNFHWQPYEQHGYENVQRNSHRYIHEMQNLTPYERNFRNLIRSQYRHLHF